MSEDTKFEETFLGFINDKITESRTIKGYYNINIPKEILDNLKQDTFFFIY